MELRQLRHVVVLAEEMHYGRAAQRLFVTQPALSASVMRLEQDLGVQLFERSSKHVKLTLAGEAMVRRAREIVSLADKSREFARAMAAGRAGTLEVGFTGTLLYRGLAEVVRRFTADNPEVELAMRELSSLKQAELVRAGRLDAGFVNTPVPPAGMQSQVLSEEGFVACLPAAHRLAARGSIDLAELRDERFVMFSREASPAYYDQMVGLCAAAGFHPRIVIEPTQVLSAVSLVGLGFGVTVVPESVRRSGIAGVAYPRIENAAVQPSAFLVWNADRDGPGLGALVETVRALHGTARTRRRRARPDAV